LTSVRLGGMATEKLSDKKEKLVKQVNTAVSVVFCGEVVALGRFQDWCSPADTVERRATLIIHKRR
jgi:hypothetical protein